jgi:rubrerythrin
VKEWNSIDDILDFAIGEEQAAAEFYTALAAQMDLPSTRQTLEAFAAEERKHEAKLVRVKEGGTFAPSKQTVPDLKIGDYLTDLEPSPMMDYQDALIVAMQKEKAAFKLYSDLAASTQDETIRTLFLALAQEEAKHKLHFEIEYDDFVLSEN